MHVKYIRISKMEILQQLLLLQIIFSINVKSLIKVYNQMDVLPDKPI